MAIKTFYSYFRSSTAYRIRIALNFKGITPQETQYINLKDGQQHSQEYRRINPAGAVPAFVLEDGTVLTQSLAMLEWLEETHPKPALLPKEPLARAQVRAFAQGIGCDIHPVNNLRVLQYLTDEMHISEDAKLKWMHQWMHRGFSVLEKQLKKSAETYCFGNQVTMADVCLIPQVYNAERFGVDLSAYPTLRQVNERCLAVEAFAQAQPERQPDCKQ